MRERYDPKPALLAGVLTGSPIPSDSRYAHVGAPYPQEHRVVGPRVRGGAVTAAPAVCQSCGAEPRNYAQSCGSCGSPQVPCVEPAEYKQVTVLFADVVHSMDIAAAVDVERLREIMTDLVDRCAVVVHHYGGTVDKFTGDGVMALFGAPVALEDHAFRACLAALDIQAET